MKTMIIVLCVVVAVAVIVVAVALSLRGRKKTAAAKTEVAENGTDTAAAPMEEEKKPADRPKTTVSERSESVVGETHAEAEKSDQPAEDSSEADTGPEAVNDVAQARLVVVRYIRSFQAKIIQSSDQTKRYYSELKNSLNSYGVKSRMSWKWETFRLGRKPLAKLRLRGKTLSLALALDPEAYADTKYIVENVSETASLADTPCLYRIKNDRRLKYAKELIAVLMQNNGLSADPNAANEDYAAKYPYETTEALLGRKLIKELATAEAQKRNRLKPSEIRASVQAQEVDKILKDEVAAALVEELGGVSDKTKTAIINIDTLAKVFDDGEKVTLPEIKKRISGYGKVTYIKVLARGTLDKKLTVEADDFSIQAVKMIILVGGKAIKK